jgi:DNA-binding MarR family transcriptional regulator
VRSRFEESFSATLPRFDVMSALYREPAGLSMGQLSRWLRVSNGNVTGVIARLEAEGYVQRKQQPEDRRWITVKLTPQGRQVFEQLAVAHESWIDEMLAALEPDEEIQLMALLSKLREGVDMRAPARDA